ncbi:MAG TPA: tannase/feruloyl esterase family alpha/beta hydrolase [Vicinamibacterales bacterium]|nr:tannase/feruloyl esterase family alpha/beta hydrolase [Vicinamibacterales bacterium]
MCVRAAVASAVFMSAVGSMAIAERQPAAARGWPAAAIDGDSCDRIASLAIAQVTVTLARVVDGTLPPEIAAESRGTRALPPFCRVAATLRPTADSDIKMEVWLPLSGWNGKYQAVGNGAFNGTIAYPAMSAALRRGYSTSSTDTGHTGNTASFAAGHPEKVIDFGWRSVHEMTVAAKEIVKAYYSAPPQRAYWTGCSAGGRQAMKEAQRFPADFDGIVAGAPGLDWTGRASQAVRIAKALEQPEARLTAAQAQLVHRAVLDACDATDGVKDGVIDNPPACRFDPAVLECKGGNGDGSCLTSAQVATVRSIYSPMVNPKTRREIGGLVPGSELGWTDRGWTASARATGLDQFRFLVLNDPAWQLSMFEGDRDAARAEEMDRDTINALDPNLKPFIDRGAKLIQYHGWSDPQISPLASTQYYKRVADTIGSPAAVERAYRLFMVPGMAHCGGGDGPNTFDMLAALEQWVERGQAPDRILASHATDGRIDRSRPLCPYPQVAAYSGRGSTDAAESFVCR